MATSLDNLANGTRPWADGFGMWHVEVPRDYPAPLTLARRLIRFEIAARGEAGKGYMLAIELVGESETHFHYKEV